MNSRDGVRVSAGAYLPIGKPRRNLDRRYRSGPHLAEDKVKVARLRHPQAGLRVVRKLDSRPDRGRAQQAAERGEEQGLAIDQQDGWPCPRLGLDR